MRNSILLFVTFSQMAIVNFAAAQSNQAIKSHQGSSKVEDSALKSTSDSLALHPGQPLPSISKGCDSVDFIPNSIRFCLSHRIDSLTKLNLLSSHYTYILDS